MSLFWLTGMGSIPFLIPFFSWIVEVFPDFDFRRQVLRPTHLCLCPGRCRLNWAARFWVPMCPYGFFLSFINHHGRQTWVPHLPVDCSHHPWFCVWSLLAHGGWLHVGWFYFRERGMFVNGRRSGGVRSPSRADTAGMGWLPPAHDSSHQFISQGQWFQSWAWFSYLNSF